MKNTSNQTLKDFNDFCEKVSKLSDEQLNEVIRQIHSELNLQFDSQCEI